MNLTPCQKPLYIHPTLSDHNTVLIEAKQKFLARIKVPSYSITDINVLPIKSRDVFTYVPPLKTQNSLWYFKHLLESCVLELNCLLPDDSPKEMLDFYIKQFATYNKIADKWNEVDPSIAITVAWAALQESDLPFNEKETLLKQIMDIQSITPIAASSQTITLNSSESTTLQRATANDADKIFQAMQTEITTRLASIERSDHIKITTSGSGVMEPWVHQLVQGVQTNMKETLTSAVTGRFNLFHFNTSEAIKTFINDPIQSSNPLTGIWTITKEDEIIGFYKIYTILKQIQSGYAMLTSYSTILLSPHLDLKDVRKDANARLKEIFQPQYNKTCTLDDKQYKIIGLTKQMEF